MVVIRGWFCKPNKSSKKDEPQKPRYRFMDTFLTDAFILTYRRLDVSDLVFTGDTRFVGGPFTMQELYQVISLRDEFNPFYVSRVVKEGIEALLANMPRTVIA